MEQCFVRPTLGAAAGAYLLRFHKNGGRLWVLIDDRIPTCPQVHSYKNPRSCCAFLK